ncbi:addiction module toxin, RelE/StbE family [Thermosinus carboxydivorans Nor1]|uniref:Addiction module toxin, RelE/StbE family n=1 Tax=Thermosinus carboxydivorans Nor1 TaxID=401526 RepID=A1HRH8_9FIRM|nr:type II toxin-antitoxin system RelE/ParE family toxin [Thermosinus carboxydivorans]EAX47309.1 addiction module toxin, RelE/StbE family [Thermosinus carboxydivorans Nor1]
MSWKVKLSDQVVKQLKKIDPVAREMLLTYLEQRIEGSADPRRYGEPLKGNLSGYWRYRIGQYRLLCEIEDIEDNEVTVYVIAIGHRREIYYR